MRESTAQNCSDFPLHSSHRSTDFNPLFHSIMLKSHSSRFLLLEAAMLQSYSIEYQNAMRESNSFAYTLYSSPKVDIVFPLKSLVLHQTFNAIHFSGKPKPPSNGPFTIVNNPVEVTCEVLTQEGKTFHTNRN